MAWLEKMKSFEQEENSANIHSMVATHAKHSGCNEQGQLMADAGIFFLMIYVELIKTCSEQGLFSLTPGVDDRGATLDRGAW